MISKNQIKFIKSLSIKKYRDQHQQAILEGYRLIEESIKSNVKIKYIYCTEKNYHKISNNKLFNSVEVFCITDNESKSLSDTKNSQGIIALIDIKKYFNNQLNDINNENIIILDGVSDPGNLGTIFRNCIWFGIKSIILTNNSIDPFNLKCIRSGMGSHFYFNNIIQEKNSQIIIEHLINNNYNIIVADLNGDDVSDISLNNNWALIFGSEAHGISKNFNKFQKITIEKVGDVESLNVSVASGILLNELNKKIN